MKKIQKINLLAIAALALTICFTSCQKDNAIIPQDPTATSDESANDLKNPPVPIPAIIQVPPGYHVTGHAFAQGFQIYKCIQSVVDTNIYTWTFLAPLANLYSSKYYTNLIGTHYAGPTWANLSGGSILGAKLQAVTVDPTAIPWLLLQKVSTTGYGKFTHAAYIQRISTVGGLAPTTNNDFAHKDQEVQIPYTATYLFSSPD